MALDAENEKKGLVFTGKTPSEGRRLSYTQRLNAAFKIVLDRYAEELITDIEAYGIEVNKGKVQSIIQGMDMLIKVATSASPKVIKGMFRGSSDVRWQVLLDYRGRVRLALLANAFHRAIVDGDEKWSKHASDLLKENRDIFHKLIKDKEVNKEWLEKFEEAQGGEKRNRADEATTEERTSTPEFEILKDFLGVDEPGKRGARGRPKGNNKERETQTDGEGERVLP